jgi:flavin reductase (DIM6/NTAB) family NADH-FMN oxidoreductase RutF
MQKKTGINQALKRKYPEPAVLVTTRSPSGQANVMAVGWITSASMEPPMFVLGIDDEAYTYELIRKTREFVVTYPNENMAKQVLHAGSCHGHKRDKLAETGLATQKASKVKAPLIADAVANFECKLVAITQPGDCPLIVGKIVAAHENRNKKVRRLYYSYVKSFTLRGVRSAWPRSPGRSG